MCPFYVALGIEPRASACQTSSLPTELYLKFLLSSLMAPFVIGSIHHISTSMETPETNGKEQTPYKETVSVKKERT